jgi:Domain of unknown function (DUF4173)
MTSPLYGATATGLSAARTPAPAVSPGVARTTLTAAVLLGASADALMHDGPGGVGLAMWITFLAVNAVVLFSRARHTPSRQAVLWLSAAVMFSLGLAWRNSGTLQAFDFLAMLFSLAMAAVSVRDPGAALFARRLRDTLFTGIDIAANTAVGVLPLAFREALTSESGGRALSHFRRIVRPALIAIGALVIFGALLRDADPIFASWINIPFDFGTIVSHLIVTGFFAWIVAGWARAGLAENVQPRRSTASLPIQLGAADITAALGTLGFLFAAFMASQIGWLFGGERFLQARTGLTAASYARQGFFQMVWVVTLVVPILVGTRAALAPAGGRALARRHTLLSLPVIVLLGAIIASAMLRMKMYVHYYGLTTDRFYPAVFMLWLATVIVWLGVTVLRDWGRPFVGGAVVSGMAFLAALNVVDPDAIVANLNVSRAGRLTPGTGPALDLQHLASLTGGGAAIAVDAVVHTDVANPTGAMPNPAVVRRCVAARMLLERWGPQSGARRHAELTGGWRYWNRDDAVAFRAFDAHSAELQRFANEGCVPPDPH